MHRAPIVIAGTIAGTAGLLAVHTHAPAVQTATASTGTSAAATATATATGAAVDTRYGPAQVKVTVKAGRITAVTAVELQQDDPRSSQISAYSAPILQQEVLSRQTTAVDAVSGATYTSASFLQSAQSALDKLGFKAADGSRTTLQVPA